VTVAGVLVEAEIGHQDDVVTELVAQVAQCDLGDAVGVPGATADLVLGRRDAKEQTPRTPTRTSADLVTSEATVCWKWPGNERNRARLEDALGDEERRHEVVGGEGGFGDQSAAAPACDEVVGVVRWETRPQPIGPTSKGRQ
jgi:hypothetical protein